MLHVSNVLAAFVDSQLSAAQMERVKAHLASCERCRGELAQIEFASGVARQVALVEAPAAVLAGIEAKLDESAGRRYDRLLRFNLRPYIYAAAACAVLAGVALWYSARASRPRWEVVRIAGAPTIGSSRLSGAGHIAEGQWLQTDAASRASLKVGTIGTVEVEPNTRMRLTVARPNEHRLTLARGEISASVSAPPRLFFVDTSSSTAVDLGCAYKIRVDENGNGRLQVTFGWVALEWGGKVSEVPAGAYCRTRKKVGPGTPYFEDAAPSLESALERFDFGSGGTAAVESILAEARLRDTLSLWHLLSRVEAAERPRVYDRLVELASLPPGITREKTLALDPATLKRWGDELVAKW
jgi:anti-sigma factor RsiW